MPTVGVLGIDLIAGTASFDASLGRARRTLADTASQMGRSLQSIEKEFGKVNRLVGTFGIGLSAAAVGAFVTSAARAAAGLGEVAEQLGVSTDALQQYRYGAIQAGLSQEQLETGLRNLTRRLGDAANGSSEAINAFRKLGIGVIDPLTGKTRSTEDAFRDLADAYKNSADKSRFASDAADLLGAKLGQRFLSFLSAGAKGLDDVAAAANAAGAVIGGKTISELDALSDSFDRGTLVAKAYAAELGINVVKALQKTGQQLTSLEGLAEAIGLTQLSRSLGGATRSALGMAPRGGTAPTLTDVQRGDGTVSGFDSSATFKRSAGPATLPQSDAEKRKIEEAKALVRALELERDSAGKTGAEILKLRMERELDIEATVREGQAVRKYTDAQVNAAVAIQEQIDARKRLLDASMAIAEAEEITARETLEAQEIANQQQKVRAEVANNAADLEEQIEAAKKATVEWDNLSQAYRVNTRELDILIEKQRLVKEGLSGDEAQEAATRTIDQTEKLRQATAKQNAEVERANELGRDFAHVIGTSLEDAMLRGAKATDIAKAALMDFSRILMRVLVTKPLENALTGAFSGGGGMFSGMGFSSLFGAGAGGYGGSWDGISTFIGSGGGEVAAGLGGFATGTDMAPAGLAWVGERGRELINFSGGEQVFRGDEIASLDGGGPTIFADLRGADAEAVQRLERFVLQINGSIERRAVAATIEARRRGGPMSKAFR